MNEFLMIFRHVPNGQNAPSPEAIQANVKQWQDWMGGLAKEGKFVSTQRLGINGKTINATELVSDGPYAEVKEIIGGLLIVKADTLDDALEIAKGCPILSTGGSVEVRDMISMDM